MKYKMAAEYCCVKKKNSFGSRPRQEILKIEIYTWSKGTNFFLMFCFVFENEFFNG